MKKICTSIEQSKTLKELGLDVQTADMFYIMFKDGTRPENGDESLNTTIEYQGLWYSLEIYEDFFEEDCFKETGVYAWTLSALLRMLPEFSIPKAFESIDLSIPTLTIQDGKWICKYDGDYKIYFDENHQQEVLFKEDEAIDAVYEMLCYILKNKK